MTEPTQVIPEDKARELRSRYLGQDVIDILAAPTPKDSDEFGKWVEKRPGRGGRAYSYVPGFRFVQRLNDAFGCLWSHRVVESFEVDGHIVTLNQVSVTVPGRTITKEHPDGTVETVRIDGVEIAKQQYGGSDIKKYATNDYLKVKGKIQTDSNGKQILKHKAGNIIDLADDYKASATDGMKKCGTEFGMFLDVYAQRGEQETGSAEQLEILYMRGEKAGLDKEATKVWAEEQLGTTLDQAEELTIMGLIPKLVEMAKAREQKK